MAVLVTLKGPNAGRRFPLEKSSIDLGRHATSAICLESQAVSRHHARIFCERGDFFIEDLDSSNGTYLNGKRIGKRAAFTERDTMQIGPYTFVLRYSPTPTPSDDVVVIRSEIAADTSSQSLYADNPAQKLQVILEITKHLGRTLDLDELLDKLNDQLMKLFPQADRAAVLLCEGNKLTVRAQRSKKSERRETFPYSRTIIRRVLQDGVGILSEDVQSDERFITSDTLVGLDLRSLLCVPLIGYENKRLGIIQLDRVREGKLFNDQDLHMLTAVSLQVSVALENVSLHAERLREERLRQEVALAREIQQGFLSTSFPDPAEQGYELYARVLPAREVAGDLYDFFKLPDGRMSFFVGDVSGKGMPAALFMIAVRILGRHLGSTGDPPSDVLTRLNVALSADNPSGMFVTLTHGTYQPKTGDVILASAGHPRPLLRRADGKVEVIALATGRMLGYEGMHLGVSDTRLHIDPGETLIVYTDGITEARAKDGASMFGPDRLRQTLGAASAQLSLEECAEETRGAVEDFTGSSDLQDDLTLFLLRRTIQEKEPLP